MDRDERRRVAEMTGVALTEVAKTGCLLFLVLCLGVCLCVCLLPIFD